MLLFYCLFIYFMSSLKSVRATAFSKTETNLIFCPRLLKFNSFVWTIYNLTLWILFFFFYLFWVWLTMCGATLACALGVTWNYCIRCEVLMAVNMELIVLWHVLRLHTLLMLFYYYYYYLLCILFVSYFMSFYVLVLTL
jgi:hypothetical protein